ncbi:MAG: hypothetical protein KC496_16895 [Anaerolineae bacterium]|nr:hypothetical protein [Anaerolineae bacterium]
MSILRANTSGELIQVLICEDEIANYAAPEETAYELEIDAETNADLIAQIQRDIDNFQLIADSLSYNGTVVTIQPPSSETQRLRQFRADNPDPLDLTAYDRENALLKALANKVAWLEAEIRQAYINS